MQMFEPGMYEISAEDYHDSHGFSRSQLHVYKELPQKFYHRFILKDQEQDIKGDSLLVGNAVHTLLQEPETFDERFVVLPEIDRRTKDGKIRYAAITERASGKELMTKAQFSAADGMADALRKNRFVSDILAHKDTQFEQSIYWREEETSLLLKARPDILNGGVVADIKTTKDASYRGMQKACLSYGYFLQAGMIKLALESIDIEMRQFIIFCVEKTPPYPTGIYFLDEDAIQFGVEQLKEIAGNLFESLKNDDWPGYGEAMLSVPAYARKKNDD